MDDPGDLARKEFNLKTNCDDPDNWLAPEELRPDYPMNLASAPYYLNYWQKGEKMMAIFFLLQTNVECGSLLVPHDLMSINGSE